jgi:8-oxo-dGTP diphosphatase
VTDGRTYPDRPYLAVSAGIIRDGRILVVRRARQPAQGLFTFPGGVVEAGETLEQALVREVREETAMVVRPVGLAGYREIIAHGPDGRVERHFVILAFAAQWVAGEPRLNEELSEARWLVAEEIASLPTTEGLSDIVRSAFARLLQDG